MAKIKLEIDKEKFIDHIKRICRKNIRVPYKICLACPFRDHVLNIMKEKGWKLPVGKGEIDGKKKENNS